MDFGLVILSLHENGQKALCGLETEDWCQICVFIIEIRVLLMFIHFIDCVESLNNFRVGHTQIPNYLWRA